MCNIAGYAGSKPAAPILLEMLRQQEGLDSGFYTGIATIHQGKIYYAKVVGTVDDLIKRTNAASLPGTIGIAHSRTPGGGVGDQWSHPFVWEKEGVIRSALVLNGWVGCFKPQEPEYLQLAAQLIEEGYTMKSAVPSGPDRWYVGNNTKVHLSDVVAQLTAKHMDAGADAVEALAQSYARMPEETAVLMLSLTEPDAIAYGRMNFPMFQGTASHGTYLATAPQAFPEDASAPFLLPAASSGLVEKDRFSCRPFPNFPYTIAPITPRVKAEAYQVVTQALQKERQTITTLRPLIKPLFEEADCQQINTLSYEILWDLHRQGKLIMEKEFIPGEFEGLQAPVLYLSM